MGLLHSDLAAGSRESNPLSYVAVPVFISGGSQDQITVQDVVYDRHSGATFDYNAQIRAAGFVHYASLDPAIATVDANGYVTRVSDGLARIVVTGAGTTGQINVNVHRSTGVIDQVFNSYVAGSLARACSDAIDGAIAGKNSAAKPLLSAIDNATPAYTRNADCWLNVDPSPIAVADSAKSPGQWLGATLISPRHVRMANHAPWPIGSVARFVTHDGNNTIVNRTITNYLQASNDACIGVLDSDVPGTIGFCKVLPSNWASYLPHVLATSGGFGVPCFGTDQNRSALITEWYQDTPYSLSCRQPSDAQRNVFFKSLIPGDSGNACCAIIGGGLVLLCSWWTGGGGGGTPMHDNIAAINAVMTTLGGGYQLTTVDLSSYPSY